MSSHAFTLKASGLIKSIQTPITIRQAHAFCQTFNLKSQEADIRALWDTGATISSISQGLATRLGLSQIDIGSFIPYASGGYAYRLLPIEKSR
jgi:predicted aspartyl protease